MHVFNALCGTCCLTRPVDSLVPKNYVMESDDGAIVHGPFSIQRGTKIDSVSMGLLPEDCGLKGNVSGTSTIVFNGEPLLLRLLGVVVNVAAAVQMFATFQLISEQETLLGTGPVSISRPFATPSAQAVWNQADRADAEATNCQNLICQEQFSVLRPKHHCHRCDHVFCDNCTHHRFQDPAAEVPETQRVCHACFVALAVARLTSNIASGREVCTALSSSGSAMHWMHAQLVSSGPAVSQVVKLLKALSAVLDDDIEVPFVTEAFGQIVGLRELKSCFVELYLAAQGQRQIEESAKSQSHARESQSYMPHKFHTVLFGPPGTGKTTIARLLADLYYRAGIIASNKFVECSKSDLVGEYKGQTQQKTKAKIESARGGVLFVDEAHTLTTGQTSQGETQFGQEACVRA